MSETTPSAAPGGMASATPEPKLYDASGAPMRASGRFGQGHSDQIGDFVQQQPMTAALVALIIGYFLGKLM